MASKYTMRISRQTVDKLGVKLYDKVSAVIAELISNSYDADATVVEVSAPMGQSLASKAGGVLTDKGFEIRVTDNGTGMTPDEMQDFFLVVGAERRKDKRRGDTSPEFGRKVMGRKGVGKLAPFGICRTIEVESAGGDKVNASDDGTTTEGYLTSHIILDYDKIVEEHDELDPDERYKPYEPTPGKRDRTLSPKHGTTIILRDFNYRRVPDIDTLARQIAQRFGIATTDWQITLRDNTKTKSDENAERMVGSFAVTTMPNTKLSFVLDGSEGGKVLGPDDSVVSGLEAGFRHSDQFFPISGWVAYSKEPYKDDLMAGVRIYCRGKIAAQTSVFNRKAGFTGEHNIRSYLVGELHADWLDEEDDLIQTDRRDILWSDELGAVFQEWGQSVVLRIGNLSRDPLRKATMDLFFEAGNVEERVTSVYPGEKEEAIRQKAIEVARMFGRNIRRAEIDDTETVKDLVDLSITLAPHITLDQMMRAATDESATPLSALSGLLRTARLAELASFGRIAEDRLKVIDRLEVLKDEGSTKEDSLQQLIEDAPWLINPEWAPVTQNQSLTTLKKEFAKHYNAVTGEDIDLIDFDDPDKRPDFVLSSQDGEAQIIEIKRPAHSLTNDEMDRIVVYYDCMDSFLNDPANAEFKRLFRDFHITLVCDGLSLSRAQKGAFEGYVGNGRMTHINWKTFLLRTEKVHEDFLNEARRQQIVISSREQDDDNA